MFLPKKSVSCFSCNVVPATFTKILTSQVLAQSKPSLSEDHDGGLHPLLFTSGKALPSP